MIVLDDVRGDVSSMVIVSSGPNIFVLITSSSMLMFSSIRLSVEVKICYIPLTWLAPTSNEASSGTELYTDYIDDSETESASYRVGGDIISWNNKVMGEDSSGKVENVTYVYVVCLIIVH